MATPDDDTQTAAPAPAAPPSSGGAPIDYAAIAQQLLQPPPQVQPDTTPAQGGWHGLLGRIGLALAGGTVTDNMSPAQKERAGIRALGDFGTSLMAGSGYYPGKPMFGGLAQGFQGAEQSERGSEEQVVGQLAAQQTYQQQQQQMQLERLKAAMPLLRMQAGANIPNLLAGGAATPGTSTGSGGPATGGGGGIALGMRQNNPLNLTFAGQPGAQPGQGNRFASFSDIPTGIAATADQLGLYQTQHGINTVQDAVKRWVSDPKADLGSYTADVAKALGVAPTDKIDLTDPAVQQKFILAAQPHESGGGGAVLNPADVAKGVQLAAANRGQTVQAQAPPAPTQFAGPGAPTGGAGATAAVPLPAAPVPTPGGAPAAPGTPTAPAQDTRPDSALTWEEFKARHGSPITPAQTAALTITPDPQLLQQAQSSMQTAAQNLQQARLSGNDDAANKAQADFEAARKNVADLKQQAAQNTATNIQKAQEAQDTLLSGQLAEARRLAATAAEADKQRQAAVDLAQLQAKLKAQENVQTSQLASRAKVLDQLDTDATSAHENLTQLQLVKQLSDAAGQPGVLASYPELRSWLTKLDIATPEQTQQWSAQQALEAATNKLTLAQRAGSGMSRVTNMDLQFLQHASPQSFNPQDWRNAQISYLQTLYQRQQQFAGLVHRGVADGMPLTDAQNAADKELGPTIKQRPSVLNGQPLDNIGQARWNFDNLEPGQFYKDEAGHLRIFTPGDATRP